MNNINIRPYKAGEASYVSYLQMKFYQHAYGFKDIFEHYLLAAMSEFTGSPLGSQLWVALDGDRIIGSIAIIKSEGCAVQLRWFIVAEEYQGKGIGSRLMETAVQFCKDNGYRQVFLWTIEALDTARHLYMKFGFKPTEKKLNSDWADETLTEERWDLWL